MSRNIDLSIGEFYHIYNRGVEKRPIYLNEFEYNRFAALLYICNGQNSFNFKDIPPYKFFKFERGESIVDIGAYCLMPNHFHILVREKCNGGISRFMQKISTSYTMYFNIKYGRTGRLFESTFKAKHVNNDQYLKYLFAYIHLNPIKLIEPEWRERGVSDMYTTKKYLNSYKHSSYNDFLNNNAKENLVLNTSEFPEYFNTPRQFEDFIDDWTKLHKTNV